MLTANQASNYFSISLTPDIYASTFFSTSGEFVVVTNTNSSIMVFKLIDGHYNMTATRNIKDLQGLASIYGNWIGVSIVGSQRIYKLDAYGNIEAKYYNLTTPNSIQAKFTSDGTYTVLTKSGIRTYAFNETAGWTLYRTNVPSNLNALANGDKITFLDGCITSTTTSTTTTNMVFRSANETWNTTAQFKFSYYSAEAPSIAYEESNQTLIFYVPNLYFNKNTFIVYTKIRNRWTNVQNFTYFEFSGADAQYPRTAMSFIDQDNLLISAATETKNDERFGAVYWLARSEDRKWTAHMKATLNTTVTSPQGQSLIYGISPTPTTSNNFIALQCAGKSYLYSDCTIAKVIPCVLDLTNVTCQDVMDIGTCGDFDLNITNYYTINTPAQCGAVAASFADFKIKPNKIEADLVFSRYAVDDVKCTVILTCDSPPIAPPTIAAAPVSVNNVASTASLVGPTLLSIGLLLPLALA